MKMSIRIETVEEVHVNKELKEALLSLLYQIADDNFIMGYRGSEWLGLAPHLEADVAFCSIAQDHMGHAASIYQLLERLGEGKADDIAHLREANQYRNAILTERPNGSGDFIVNPDYDWAYAVVRQYIFDLFEEQRMSLLKQSTFTPLAQLANKIMREKMYHKLHGEIWIKQMATSTDQAKSKLDSAIERVWIDLEGLFELGEFGEKMVEYGLITSEEERRDVFLKRLKNVFDQFQINWPGEPTSGALNGRLGQHTNDLETALDIISEVYRLDPAADW
jgi:ring-1,2-phenylacetyl-CoA epoxidase subunit PaaC